jgi:hypothetical protein
MKSALIYFLLIILLFAACDKYPENNIAINVKLPREFIPVAIFGGAGNWGGGICSWGFIMVRQDSTITYHSVALPANTTIPNIPTLVNIQFHDTVQISNCWHEIVVDSVKF